MVNTSMTHVFRHPKFYRIPRDKSDQAISLKLTTVSASVRRIRATSLKLQAASFKHQASSSKVKHQATSVKPQQQASSLNPQASSSMIREPRKSFTVPGPRASAMINVLCGCFTWKAIWCGENLILFPLHTFNSTVKKWPELL